MPYVQLTVKAIDIRPGDVFRRHGRTWTVVDVHRSSRGAAHIEPTGGGHVWLARGCDVGVRRPVQA
ncbi:hypothetical protein AB0A77_01905 [Streptomyces varsoviensis]|uniref:hypothetical protein n=1 Tax=Streptomyces varsoviensis TaxID=67373 RepID=UPI0033E0F0B9